MSTVAIIIFAVIILGAVGVLAWALLQDAFINVKPGEIGLVITRGKPADHGLPPGVHFALRFGRVIEVYPSVELTYLTVGEAEVASTPSDALTFVDPPLRVALGDRTAVLVNYTVRFALTSEGLPTIHTRFGTAGINGIVRDESRRVLIASMGEATVGAADVLGAARAPLEERVGAMLAQDLQECGFAMTMFNIRDVDLGVTGEVIQATLRAREELERERALGSVRALRAEQEAEINSMVSQSLSGTTLEYLRLQATRELIERWDGKLLMPPGSAGLVPPDGTAASPVAPPPETPTGEPGQTGL